MASVASVAPEEMEDGSHERLLREPKPQHGRSPVCACCGGSADELYQCDTAYDDIGLSEEEVRCLVLIMSL